MADSSDSDDLLSKFSAWLEIENVRDGRHFLEGYPELLDPENASTLDTFLVNLREHKNEIQQKLNIPLEQIKQTEQNVPEHLNLLHNIRRDGGTTEAMRAVYIDTYWGLVLDLPPWLDAAVEQLADLHGD